MKLTKIFVHEFCDKFLISNTQFIWFVFNTESMLIWLCIKSKISDSQIKEDLYA